MTRLFHGTVTLLLVWAVAWPAGARTFTVREAMTEAVAASDAVAAAEARSEQERARADAALLMFFPAATLTAGYVRMDTAPYTEMTL